MKISDDQTLSAPRAQVWSGLQDPQTLTNSLPGVRRLEVVGTDSYSITIDIGVGSVKGTYEGTFELTDKRELSGCGVRIVGRGGPGTVDAQATMALSDHPEGGTAMYYEADATVTGPLAGVGQRLIASAAKKTARDFLKALDEELLNPAANGAATTERLEPPATPDVPAGKLAQAEPADSPQTRSRPAAPAARTTFEPTPRPASARGDLSWRVFAAGVVMGFTFAVIAVLIGQSLN